MTHSGGEPRWEIIKDEWRDRQGTGAGTTLTGQDIGTFPLAVYEKARLRTENSVSDARAFPVKLIRRAELYGGIATRTTTTSPERMLSRTTSFYIRSRMVSADPSPRKANPHAPMV